MAIFLCRRRRCRLLRGRLTECSAGALLGDSGAWTPTREAHLAEAYVHREGSRLCEHFAAVLAGVLLAARERGLDEAYDEPLDTQRWQALHMGAHG